MVKMRIQVMIIPLHKSNTEYVHKMKHSHISSHDVVWEFQNLHEAWNSWLFQNLIVQQRTEETIQFFRSSSGKRKFCILPNRIDVSFRKERVSSDSSVKRRLGISTRKFSEHLSYEISSKYRIHTTYHPSPPIQS